MPYLTINPKEKGTTVKFGKLPIFTRSLTHWADMDNVVQLKVEGRYYAIELRKTGLEKALDEMREQAIEKPKQEAKLTKDLEELGFVSLKAKPVKQVKVRPSIKYSQRTPGVDYAGRPVRRDNLSLFEWLKRDDYLIAKLFISDSGRPLIEKAVDYDDICLVFLNAGVPDRGNKSTRVKGKTAQNYTNVVIAQLLRKGILQKEEDTEQGKKMYSLTLTKGGAYARGLYAVIRKGEYDWDSKTYRRVVNPA